MMVVVEIFWCLMAVCYGVFLLICVGGPPPAAPSHLSRIRRLEYYLCHRIYRQTLLGLIILQLFGNMLVAIDQGQYSCCIFWPSPSPRPFLEFLSAMLLIAAFVLFLMAYGRRGDPEAEAAEKIDLYLTCVQYYWY
ncbi:uncharacterized protein BKA55DRAFT_107056 [Fusarium redolens]|uniref:Uncharacterized protein n=1 Tax=Fusarium redolens TaxID=48865 RepID=A0A9P9GN31_FUSRE|nr:uncharacterized protein BKA55DRAFT_107056 [Fusarium redolens]KAH7240922.1 hypothetical protein BKA55DRAFT_107056 [Fusarium redolens]